MVHRLLALWILTAALAVAPTANAQTTYGITPGWVAAGVFGSSALDYASTRHAMTRPGNVEANPIMASLLRHEPAAFAVKMGVGAGVSYITWKLMRSENPSTRKAGFWMGVGVIALNVWVTQHNIRVANAR